MQIFAADDISRRHFQMHFFLGALRVKLWHFTSQKNDSALLLECFDVALPFDNSSTFNLIDTELSTFIVLTK